MLELEGGRAASAVSNVHAFDVVGAFTVPVYADLGQKKSMTRTERPCSSFRTRAARDIAPLSLSHECMGLESRLR